MMQREMAVEMGAQSTSSRLVPSLDHPDSHMLSHPANLLLRQL
jgi:hypothetical protein